jgi:hypothetical protein
MLRSPAFRPIVRHRAIRIQYRTLWRSRQSGSFRAVENFDINRLAETRRNYDRDKTYFLAAGALAGIIACIYTALKLKKAIANQKAKEAGSKKRSNEGQIQLDSDIPTETYTADGGARRKLVVHDAQGREVVPTGNSVVPEFPRNIVLPSLPTQATRIPNGSPPMTIMKDDLGDEYTLVGLGTRSVSFLGIQVYVVGFYVATSDIARLQNYLVKKVNPIATTLVPSERDSLRLSLLDPANGEKMWAETLREANCRTALRLVPVKDTDFHHLRDGFVRSIAARSQQDKQAYGDEGFGEAMRQFRSLFNRGSMPKRKELILYRDGPGYMRILYNSGKGQPSTVLGEVDDERISSLLWLNYLAGKKVASEEARQSIIDGVMEFVERPVGTVAAQVISVQ